MQSPMGVDTWQARADVLGMNGHVLLRRLHRRCVVLRQEGSHVHLRCGRCRTIVPAHSAELFGSTLRAIERDLEPCLGRKWLRNAR